MKYLKFPSPYEEGTYCLPVQEIKLITFGKDFFEIEIERDSFRFDDAKVCDAFEHDFWVALVDPTYSIWEISVKQEGEEEFNYYIEPWVP